MFSFFGASVHFVGGIFVCSKSLSRMFFALQVMVNLCPETLLRAGSLGSKIIALASCLIFFLMSNYFS